MPIETHEKGSTEKLSKNFNVSEFLCKGSGCCSSGKIDTQLVHILQMIRDHFNKPVYITSAYRCPSWNAAVGGVPGSYHTYGQAADIKVEDTAPAEVAKYAESIGVLGIGLYETPKDGYFVHIDTRTKKSFWYGQKQQYRDTFGGAVQNPVNTVEIKLPVLQLGDSGDSVKALQILITGYGFPCGDIDGIFGAETKRAFEKYQVYAGLTKDAVCGIESWSALTGIK